MLSIQIICIGKLKETYLKDALSEYTKRLKKYCHLQIIELLDEKLPTKVNPSTLNEVKHKECQRILHALSKDSYVIALDLAGKQLSSEEFSEKINSIALHHSSNITFIIGGTLGLTSEVLSSVDEKISFSKMTFPHQLIRIFLLEQIFRAFKISNGETYHW